MKHRRHYCGFTKLLKRGGVTVSSPRCPTTLKFHDRDRIVCLALHDFICLYRNPEAQVHAFDIMVRLFPQHIKQIADWYVTHCGGFGKFDMDKHLAGIKAQKPILDELDKRGVKVFREVFLNGVCGIVQESLKAEWKFSNAQLVCVFCGHARRDHASIPF